jgi:hypothetical protein
MQIDPGLCKSKHAPEQGMSPTVTSCPPAGCEHPLWDQATDWKYFNSLESTWPLSNRLAPRGTVCSSDDIFEYRYEYLGGYTTPAPTWLRAWRRAWTTLHKNTREHAATQTARSICTTLRWSDELDDRVKGTLFMAMLLLGV